MLARRLNANTSEFARDPSSDGPGENNWLYGTGTAKWERNFRRRKSTFPYDGTAGHSCEIQTRNIIMRSLQILMQLVGWLQRAETSFIVAKKEWPPG